ncbi:MAG: response regulator [Isosphaeraceae bacterium]|nr:response regulator [Isosphaeraceae bacterium]
MPPVARILLVDDEPNLRLLFKTVLASENWQVCTADDGESALLWLGSDRFDLVLLDLRMPGIGGMDVLESLRAMGDGTPVVVITAHGSVPDAVAAMKLGAIDFLSKPMLPSALRRVVAEVLERHSAPAVEPSATARGAAQVADRLANAKRALNRRAFGEADALLRQAIDLDPNLGEAHRLLGLLRQCEESEQNDYRGLCDWFPVGRPHRND